MTKQKENLSQILCEKVSTEGVSSKRQDAYEEMDIALEVDEGNETKISPNEQKKRVKEKLKECIESRDLDKALAIIDYVKTILAGKISPNDLSLRNKEDKNSIAYIAHQNDIDESYENFISVCKGLEYIGETTNSVCKSLEYIGETTNSVCKSLEYIGETTNSVDP